MSEPIPPVEWLYFSKRGRVVHAIDPEATGWARTERSGALAAYCNLSSNVADSRDPDHWSSKCFRCWTKVLKLFPDEHIVVLPEEVLRLEKSRKIKLDSDVYCLAHTCVHENTMDPYGEGYGTCLEIWNGTGIGTKKSDVHRTLFWGARKGDYPDA